MTLAPPEVDPQPVGRLRATFPRGREFRLLFAGQAVSNLGDRVVMVAMPFAVLSLPHSSLGDVGLVLGASALSLALFVLIGGVYGDRLPRQRTMLLSDVVRGLAQAATAALLLTGSATVGRLVLLQIVYGAAEAFFRPAALGLIPLVVNREEIQQANAMIGLSANVGMMAGPALAGALVAVAGAGVALAVDAGTFAVSAAALALLRPHRTERSAATRRFLAELAGGWREVRSRAWVWSIILGFSAYHFLVLPALFVLGPAVANADRGGAAAWGLISAGFGVGSVSGGLLALRWRPRRTGIVIVGSLCVGATQCSIVVSPLPTVAVAALEAVTGVGVVLCFTIWETALQERIPPAAQSRVSSFDYLGSLTLMPVGYLVIGPAAAAVGDRPAAAGATVATLAVLALVAAGRDVRRLRRTDHLCGLTAASTRGTPETSAPS